MTMKNESKRDASNESLLLGCLIVEGQTSLNEVREIVQVKDFKDERNAVIYKAILELGEKGMPYDAVLVFSIISQNGQMEEVGGIEYLAGLIVGVEEGDDALRFAKAMVNITD